MKYKVYDTINKTMYKTFVTVRPDGTIDYLNEEGYWVEDTKNRFIPCLYSDVNDINGNEIYHHAKVVCQSYWDNNDLLHDVECSIEFEDGCFCFVGTDNPNVSGELDGCEVYNNKIKVIEWNIDVKQEI